MHDISELRRIEQHMYCNWIELIYLFIYFVKFLCRLQLNWIHFVDFVQCYLIRNFNFIWMIIASCIQSTTSMQRLSTNDCIAKSLTSLSFKNLNKSIPGEFLIKINSLNAWFQTTLRFFVRSQFMNVVERLQIQVTHYCILCIRLKKSEIRYNHWQILIETLHAAQHTDTKHKDA